MLKRIFVPIWFLVFAGTFAWANFGIQSSGRWGFNSVGVVAAVITLLVGIFLTLAPAILNSRAQKRAIAVWSKTDRTTPDILLQAYNFSSGIAIDSKAGKMLLFYKRLLPFRQPVTRAMPLDKLLGVTFETQKYLGVFRAQFADQKLPYLDFEMGSTDLQRAEFLLTRANIV